MGGNKSKFNKEEFLVKISGTMFVLANASLDRVSEPKTKKVYLLRAIFVRLTV